MYSDRRRKNRSFYNNKNKSNMQTAEEIMNKHFKECFETHNEKVSEKYILYFHKAMKEYAQQEREKAVSELLGLIQNTKIV